ncbi:MaoC/PaaZ C-terminal domain-containing protein, partial [Streptomyces abyssalis]
RLSAPPRLAVVLARGALASRSKRGPYEQARLPAVRLMLPDAVIDAGRLRAYSRVCGFGTGGDTAGQPPAGPQSAPAPASYPHVLGFPLAMQLMARPDFPFPVLGLVHTGVELTQHRALRPGDRPEISVYANGLAPHRRGSSFDVVTEARLDGRLVWHSRSTYLCRHRTAGAPGEPAREPGVQDGLRPGVRTGTRAEDPGQPPAPLPLREHWDLPSGLGRRYGRASGDRNPIHLHPLTAKLFGFPRHIAHGMWTFARSLAGTGAAAGGEQLTARAEFKAPVLLPSRVAYCLDEPTASAGGYRAPVRVHRFELRSGGDGNGERQRLHLSGEVTSERP